ncbi:hypothetical protein [Circoviridae sp.]|nr:hypothetical protein [Circoviridae sp.]UOF81921.1 hypothetical protein [Circoviridae sp.]
MPRPRLSDLVLSRETRLELDSRMAQVRDNDADLVYLYRMDCRGKLFRMRKSGYIPDRSVRLNKEQFRKFIRSHLEHTASLLANTEHIRFTPPPTYTLTHPQFSARAYRRSDQEIVVSARRRIKYLINANSNMLFREHLHKYLNHRLKVDGDEQESLLLASQEHVAMQRDVRNFAAREYVNAYDDAD